MKKFPIPVVFCSDHTFTAHIAVAMISLMDSNKEFNFQFVLISSDLDKERLKKLKSLVNSRKSEFTCIHLDQSDFDGFPLMQHISKAAYFRINIPKILKDKLILYLDADIVCVGDISSFLKLELSDKILAAITDPIFRWHEDLNMSPGSRYFNSGVMLINTEAWNDAHISDRVLDFIQNHKDKIRFVDQCGLNAVIDGNWLELSPKFNQQAILFREDFNFEPFGFALEELENARKEPILIHYTGPSKPWHYNNNHPYKHIYWNFQSSSPFKLRYPEGMKFPDHLKSLFPNSLKKYLKEIFK